MRKPAPPGTDDRCFIRTGCAGWSLPRAAWPAFSDTGTHLQRYAGQLNATEINSSFYRPHRRETYARWAASVPDDFRFSVKLPKAITHEKRLRDCTTLLDAFGAQISGLGEKLGCVLVQLPPSLAFDGAEANAFFDALRERYSGSLVVEARHASWFTPALDACLKSWRAGRVLADPMLFEGGESAGSQQGLPHFLSASAGAADGAGLVLGPHDGDHSIAYLRLHGSPRMYYSAYERALLDALAKRLLQACAAGVETWCMFDNTASGAATEDALYLKNAVGPASSIPVAQVKDPETL